MKIGFIKAEYVIFIPEQLDNGILYISEKYSTTVHKCACGCGKEVVLQLSPSRWQLRKSGTSVSLNPSVGNWDYPCRSHYWIKNNRIIWAGAMSAKSIAQVKALDRLANTQQVEATNQLKSLKNKTSSSSLWTVIRNFFRK